MIKEFSLEGRKALCVGAGRGIGKGLAAVLAEAGADVAIASFTMANAEKALEGVLAHGRAGKAFQVDATDEASMMSLARAVESDFGDIDILVNCVGDSIRRPIIPLPDGPDGEMPLADWRFVIDINLTHAFLGARVFGPRFLERKSGVVINISTNAQNRARLHNSAYDAGKQALNQLTRDLAVEWASYGVRVNAIGPGTFPDPAQRSPEDFERSRQEIAKRVPLGREGHFRDVGLLAVYLASEASSYVTGQVFIIDGGAGLV